MKTDVTNSVYFGDNDGEALPLLKCVCGQEFQFWDEILGTYSDRPWTCAKCGVKLFFNFSIRVFKVE